MSKDKTEENEGWLRKSKRKTKGKEEGSEFIMKNEKRMKLEVKKKNEKEWIGVNL